MLTEPELPLLPGHAQEHVMPKFIITRELWYEVEAENEREAFIKFVSEPLPATPDGEGEYQVHAEDVDPWGPDNGVGNA